jgi:hypothetical protein
MVSSLMSPRRGGEGGYQRRFRAVFQEIHLQGWIFAAMIFQSGNIVRIGAVSGRF